MVPIYESDLAEQRWTKAEWERYELWEKVELRLKRNQRRWILATLSVIFILFAVPIFTDHKDKWLALKMSRLLAQEISLLKREASLNRNARRIQFLGNGSLQYKIEELTSCTSKDALLLREGTLGDETRISLLSPPVAQSLGIPGLEESFCYDSAEGAFFPSKSLTGFGLIPVKDLTNPRQDRVSLLLVSGPSGELSFE